MQITVSDLTHNAILDASPIPTSVVDAKGTVVYVNDAFLMHASKVWGEEIRREDRIGKNVRAFIPGRGEYDRQEWLELYDRVLEKGEAVFLQGFRERPLPDREVYLDVRMNPIKGEDGRMIAAVLAWQDVTDRVTGQREERRRVALDRVRAEVFAMRKTADIDGVLTAIYRELRTIGVPFNDCSINLLKEGTEPPEFESYCITSDRVWVIAAPAGSEQIGKMWRMGEPVYRRDLDGEDVHGEKRYIDGIWGKRIRSVVDVPFSKGTLAINSVEADAFSEEDIELLKGFAEVLSEGYTRFEDIRRIEKSEKALRESEERYRNLVERANDGIAIIQDTIVKYINPRLAEMRGETVEEIIGTPFTDYVHPDELPKVVDRYKRRMVGEDVPPIYETVLKRRDGSKVYAELNAGILTYQGKPADLVIVRDITERKRAEQALRASHRFLEIVNRHTEMIPLLEEFVSEVKNVTGCSAVGLRMLDEEGNIPYQAYEGFSQQFYESESPLSIHSDQCMCINVVKGSTDPELSFYTEGESFYMNGTTRFLATVSEEEKGQTRNVCNQFGYESVALVPIRLGDRVLGLIHVADSREDMVPLEMVEVLEGAAIQLGMAIQRVWAEEARKESEERYRTLIQRSVEAIYMFDPETKHVLEANPAFLKLLECTAEEVLTLTVYDFVAHDRASIDAHIQHILTSGGMTIGERVWRRRDGSLIDVQVTASKIRQRGRDIVFVVARDITEERRIQQRVQEQERLAAVGQLAAGIAHDFNNLLTGIIGYAELLQIRGDVPEFAKADLKTIELEGQRAAHLIRQILDFSRKSVIERKPLNLVSFLKEAIKFLERTIPESIHIVPEMGPGEYVVNADPAQIQQVVTNLAVNARDAMPEGGELRLGLSRLTLDPGERQPFPGMSPGEWIVLSVSDTGVGIPPDVLPHLYEPFFTTKEVGEGTGLGLSQVYGIVKQHDGFIDVESEVGKGTTFVVYLPKLATAEYGHRAPGVEGVPTGKEKLLLVEDEPMVLNLGCSLLESLGYTVLTAENGEEAMDVYRVYRDEIALVLTDMVMPKMGGEELYEALKPMNPGVKVVLMTGYAGRRSEDELRALGFKGLVQKPFQYPDLARVVRDALDE